jgi:hypothetical protein
MELTLQKTSWPNLLFNPSLILNQGGIGLILFNQLGQNKHVPNYHWKKKWRWNWKEIKAPMKTAMEQVHCIPHLLLDLDEQWSLVGSGNVQRLLIDFWQYYGEGIAIFTKFIAFVNKFLLIVMEFGSLYDYITELFNIIFL